MRRFIGSAVFWLIVALGYGAIAGLFVYYVWAAYFYAQTSAGIAAWPSSL